MRYYCNWFPPLVYASFLHPGMYHYKRRPLFYESLSASFVCIMFAMVELNILEHMTGERKVAITKKDNPLQREFSFWIFSAISTTDLLKQQPSTNRI